MCSSKRAQPSRGVRGTFTDLLTLFQKRVTIQFPFINQKLSMLVYELLQKYDQRTFQLKMLGFPKTLRSQTSA